MPELDRTQPTPHEIYYAARRAADAFLPSEAQNDIQIILKRGYQGEKVDNDVLRIVSRDEGAREWMAQALYLEVNTRGYVALPGELTPIPARSLWRCPEEGCGFAWRVLRKGRPVPPCPIHDVPLVPVRGEE
jgi:hypothetical protein